MLGRKTKMPVVDGHSETPVVMIHNQLMLLYAMHIRMVFVSTKRYELSYGFLKHGAPLSVCLLFPMFEREGL